MKAVSGEGIAIKRSGFANKDANVDMNERVCGSRTWEGKKICLCAVTNRVGITGILWEGHWRGKEPKEGLEIVEKNYIECWICDELVSSAEERVTVAEHFCSIQVVNASVVFVLLLLLGWIFFCCGWFNPL